MEPIELELGDPCPACGGELAAARVPTDDDYARAFDKENPVALPHGADTASPDQRADLGALYRCVNCRYQTRFPGEGGEGADEGAGEGAGGAGGGSKKRTGRATTRRGSK